MLSELSSITLLIWLSAGPGRTSSLIQPSSKSFFSYSLMPLAISTDERRIPVLVPTSPPYHSAMRMSDLAGGQNLRPSSRVASSPFDSAHQPTLNGAADPQSKERSMRHDFGTMKRGTM